MSPMSLLSIEGVTRQFGGLTAVDKVSFDIEPGKVSAIIGPNGAGKTTLFNLISGFMPPSEGHIRFQGEDITALALVTFSAAEGGTCHTRCCRPVA